MGVSVTQDKGLHGTAHTRAAGAGVMERPLVRALGVSALSLALALAWLPAAAAGPSDGPQGMSPAAASARALLNAPRPATPITTHAGMGTADPARAPASAPVAAGVDAAGNGEAQPPAAAPTRSGGIDDAGNGETPAAATTAAPAVAPPALADGQPPAPTMAPPATGAAQTAPAQPAQAQSAPAPSAPAPSTATAARPAAPVPAAPARDVANTPAAAPARPATTAATPTVAPAARASAAPATRPAQATVSPTAQGSAAPQAATPQAANPQAAAPQAAIPSAPDGAVPSAEAVAAAPVSGPLAPVAEAVAMQIAQPSGLGATKKETEALVTFYTARQGLPVFVDERGMNARGTAVLARLHAAGEDGLDPDDYAVSQPAGGADATRLAATELRLAVAALTYARHAQSGRFEPSRISELVTPTREIPDPAAVLATLADAHDVNGALAAYNPPHTGYKALKARLAAMNGPRDTTQVMIPAGGLVKPGDSDPRVPALRARLGLAAIPGDLTYDAPLVAAVKAFQGSVRLKPTGIVGAATVVALNRAVTAVPSAELRADIIANMERWRWLPRDLGAYYVWVNIPEYLARIHEGDKVIHETRIVVGKKETPTPLLTQDMRYAVVNPAWNIPPSIARKEMMPLLRSDPSALSRRGIEVVRNGSGGYTFRQSPGERNALGRIKFMFPNDHSVYLHDTPSKALFAREQRAFSHGCMRVQDPLEFGEVLFNIGLPGESWSAQRIGKMFGGKERYVTLKQRIPVHVVYFTTFVNEAGRLETRDDLYGWNADVKARLGLDNARRRMADGNSSARR